MLPAWIEVVAVVGSIATPLIVAGFGVVFTRRQGRNDELLRFRIECYQQLVPDMNMLMCYLTFIGTWRDTSPPAVLELKRRLDRNFYCAAPLFSDSIYDRYAAFMDACFQTFGTWGEDAKIRSSTFRRRPAWRGDWDPGWETMFAKSESEAIPALELGEIRKKHDHLVAALVADLRLTSTRDAYTTNQVSLNAHAPTPRDIGATNSGLSER
ncbi:hypothetical protein ATJ88_2226 [Isoptericola jiangsuensis]|uniref:Uncharacterized protein n=1 Tax=Isoptericola jiangsuensis TaxID=548579 RepID=A0A2A9EZF5_9MICO|nr:hypothetical protein [Isoptericola jiangsuensis]PFG43529.1 hypothetical protein ATJ88_2226 [Isoptericola jiangsuensis]